MKYLFLFLFFSVAAQSQVAQYGKVNKKSTFDAYITKAGNTIKAGDTIHIKLPSTDTGFMYISQGQQKVSAMLADTKVEVDKIKSYGNKKRGYKVYLHFKGYGMLPVLIDYETALIADEIYNPFNQD